MWLLHASVYASSETSPRPPFLSPNSVFQRAETFPFSILMMFLLLSTLLSVSPLLKFCLVFVWGTHLVVLRNYCRLSAQWLLLAVVRNLCYARNKIQASCMQGMCSTYGLYTLNFFGGCHTR